MPSGRHLVLVNPAGGRNRAKAVLERMRPLLVAAGADVQEHITRHPGDAESVVATAGPLAAVCVIGGDGTIHEVVNGLLARTTPPPPIAVVPAGTGNVVARELGLTDPEAAVQALLDGHTRPFDAIRVQTPQGIRHGISIVGWGAAVDINRMAERLRATGSLRYSLAALAHLVAHRERPARITLDDHIVEDSFQFVIACNTQRTGSSMFIAPRSRPDDGLLDVVLVRHASRAALLQMFLRVGTGRHLDLPCVEYHQVRTFAIETPVPDGLNLDGELRETAPASVSVLPRALRFFARSV